MKRGTKALAAAVMGALWALPAWGGGEIAYRTIALTGQQAAGMKEGVTYGELSTYAVIDASGQVAYSGTVKGADPNETVRVLWAGMPNSPQVVMRSGPVPEWSDGVKLEGMGYDLILNAQGQIAVRASVRGAVPSGVLGCNCGIWAGQLGEAKLVVHDNMPVPGSQVTFKDTNRPIAISDSGAVGFGANLSDGSSGAWVAAGGLLQPLLRSGDAAPGFDAGVSIVGAGSPRAAGGRRWVIAGTIKGPGVRAEKYSVMWRGKAGALQPILREGDVAPGTNACFYGALLSHVNAKGHVLTGYHLRGGDATKQNDYGMWLVSDSETRLVARQGDPAPGMPEGVRMDHWGGQLSSGSDEVDRLILIGDVAGTGVTEDNKMAVWTGELGALRLVARAGDHAPGTPAGIVFGRHRWGLLTADSPAFEGCGHVNARGQVAFLGFLRGRGINDTNCRGIWATTADGTLKLVAREGDLFDVGGGDMRKILSLLGFNTGLVDRMSFNDRSELVFGAKFADRTSAVVVAYVREPG